MVKKKFKKFIRHFLGLVALRSFWLIAAVFPLGFIYKVSRFLARLTYILANRLRKIAEEGISIAFGDRLDRTEKRKIILRCLEEAAKGALELLVLAKRPEALKKRVSIRGIDNLEKGLSSGKGVICVSAHFGNFPLLIVRLQAEGFPTSTILRPMRDEKLDSYFLKMRQEIGLESIYSKPAKACVDKSLAFLRKNGLLFLQLDQNFGSGKGVFVNFFGKQAATATGPVVFALRSKARILPVFIIRNKDNTQEIVIEPEFVIEEQKDYKETVQHNISRLTAIIESYIRKYPSQWSWIHRRWKSRPGVE